MSQWQPNEKLKPTLSEVMEPVAPAVELVAEEETETVEPQTEKSTPGETLAATPPQALTIPLHTLARHHRTWDLATKSWN